MSVQNLFNGKNIVLSLVFFLAYLIFSYLQSNDPLLASLQQIIQVTPTVAPEPTQEEDIIEEHEPDTASGSSQQVAGAATNRQEAQVVKVVDGDTIEVVFAGKREKIRIIGIDTPETVDPRKPVQCFGREASSFAKQNLGGQAVQLESDPSQGDRDKYQRLLRFVFLENGTDFGKLEIQEGYAHEYTYDLPYKYQSAYKQAERSAMNAKKGLWADAACS